MAVGAMLDPRYKLCFLDFFYPIIYGEQHVSEMNKMKGICEELVKEYEIKMKDKESIFSSQTLNLIVVGADGVNIDWRAKYQCFVSEQNIATAHSKSELDIYLEDGVLPDQGGEFDILTWWKVNGIKYPTLQRIARDLLAIPISTVASESSFSTGGRILTPHHSRLRPDTIETLMCLQDWQRCDMKGSSNSKLDIIECGTVLEDFDVSNIVKL
ncbi:PREDICTED: zinc finger BED domain-containing protein RICESLEEPER 2-like [Lupinus angustifolius]|uniref:zinc finger BED domain-containing protein RICESLEEPER 2-like n=1 Tax=Lupinus angustifolius TaxID=3871 RepID=UPI00092F4041|nr:PREDICTED: zinc finger BED domain-containing protein RICESLEEPER 2-like [Lupinus angustifolius]